MHGTIDNLWIVKTQGILIERRQRAAHRTQNCHGVGIEREAIVKQPHVLMQHGVPPQRQAKIHQLRCRGQLSVNQQVTNLDEIAIGG